MENQPTKTPMQELIEILQKTKESLDNQEKFKEIQNEELSLKLSVVIDLLNNSFHLEASQLSASFDYGFLQAELKEKAFVTNGAEYVKTFYKKYEDISSEV
jgi:DNA polymerase III epsilon subunit-like protein